MIEEGGRSVDLFTLALPELPDGVDVRSPENSVVEISVTNVFVADLALTGVAGLWALVAGGIAIATGAALMVVVRVRRQH